MSRPPNDVGDSIPHLSLEDLGSVAEGRASPEAIRHLSQCRTCMAAYADGVRYRAAWLTSPERFASPAAGEPAVHRRRTPVEVVVWVGAAALIAIGVALVVVRPWRPPSAGAGMPPEIRQLLVHASSRGLVFPGAEGGAGGDTPSYRTDLVITDQALSTLETMRQQIESGESLIDRLYALSAGLIAAGRVDLAHDYIGEARARAPRDARFLVLAAMVSMHGGEKAEAESLLQFARQLVPGDPTVALDLGLVVHQTRGLTDARPYLLEAAEKVPGSPTAQRARQLLEGAPSP